MTEKCVSAMASGKWILHPDYIEKSFAKNQWEDEQNYEMVHHSNEANLPFAKGAKRCRELVIETGKMMMNDWSVLNVVDEERRKPIKK
jgi:hypothetical protein